MLSLRTHAIISAGILAAIIVLAMIGDALHGSGLVPESAGARLASLVTFLGLAAALMLSAVPLMVKLVLGVQAGFDNTGNPAINRLIARERLIVFLLWGLIVLGLMIAVPAVIIDGAFD